MTTSKRTAKTAGIIHHFEDDELEERILPKPVLPRLVQKVRSKAIDWHSVLVHSTLVIIFLTICFALSAQPVVVLSPEGKTTIVLLIFCAICVSLAAFFLYSNSQDQVKKNVKRKINQLKYYIIGFIVLIITSMFLVACISNQSYLVHNKKDLHVNPKFY